MAGNISNSNIWNDKDTSQNKEVEKMFSEMVGWAVDEGADILIGETFYYAEEAYTALKIMKQSGLPSVITIAPMGENIMRDGISILDTCKELEQRGGDVVGMNCFRGPTTMMPYLKEIRKALKCHVAALPINYRTTKENPTFFNLPDNNGCTCHTPHKTPFPTALDPMQCNRYEIGKFAKEAFDLGINYLGVCCGANPMLIREVAEAVGLKVPASKYKENMSSHFLFGTHERIPKTKKNIRTKLNKFMIKQLVAKDIKSYLMAEPSSVLLDVRTNEEWETIGKPEGDKIGLKTYFLSIQFSEERIFNENFVQEFENLAINQDRNILIICRSGARSQFAAELLNKENYTCINISDGFEGNQENVGWKKCGLPC